MFVATKKIATAILNKTISQSDNSVTKDGIREDILKSLAATCVGVKRVGKDVEFRF